jgi:hypothetical protein
MSFSFKGSANADQTNHHCYPGSGGEVKRRDAEKQ